MGLITIALEKLPFTSTTVPAALALYLFNHTAQGNLVLGVGVFLQVLYLIVRFIL